jgi:hypothetical protein
MMLAATSVEWNADNRPVVIANGKAIQVESIDSPIQTETAYVVGINQGKFEQLTRYLRAEMVHFYEMRVPDLSGLARLGSLRSLAIRWNTKMTSLDQIGDLRDLDTLILEDTPKVTDLGPVADLGGLRAFEYSGGIWNKNTAQTLEPIGSLTRLEEIRLTNLRVREGGLRPLARCKALQHLTLSNQFPTADYAYLSVALPEAECDMFAPHIRLSQAIDAGDIMVVGSRKPFLDSVEDAARLQRYEEAFRRLQEGFAADFR